MSDLELFCERCHVKGSFGDIDIAHFHDDLAIGGVPQNIWIPNYTVPKSLPTIKKYGVFDYESFIPFKVSRTSLGEGSTPLVKIRDNVWLKDESVNPTVSFKDRGIATMVGYAKLNNIKKIAMPSTGNAAISLGVYGNNFNIETQVYVPKNIKKEQLELLEKNSDVIFCDTLVSAYENFFISMKRNDSLADNGFPVTNIPYYQGIKTLAFEIYAQLATVPDYVILPCGSGTNIVGQYEGFKNLQAAGLIEKIPRFIPVQIKGADPITYGFREGMFNTVPVLDDVFSKASAIASDTNFNYFRIMSILKETNGFPISVSDEEIENTYLNDFPNLSFSSRSVYAAISHLEIENKDEVVVLVGTAK